jgi:NAD kinase
MTQPATERKIVLVTRKTRLDDLIARFNTEDQARFYIEHLGSDFADYQHEDHNYKAALSRCEQLLARLGRIHVLDRVYLPNYVFGPQDFVVVLGQDGLVANTVKYLDGQPLVGVNPDPARWEGILVPFVVSQMPAVMEGTMAGRRPLKPVTMAMATLNTGHVLLGVNDLFVGARTHVSARYTIKAAGREERHSSSGVIISTGLGSSGWLRSVLAGASGIASAAAGRDPGPRPSSEFPWDADHLVFSVREPWPSKTSGASITFGKVTREEPLVIVSQMPENGVVFSDGIEADFVEFNAGTSATVGISPKKGLLVS